MRSSDTHVRAPTQASEIEREEVLQERDTERGDREREEREKRQGVMYQQQGRKEKGMKVPEVCRRHLHDCEAKSRTCRRAHGLLPVVVLTTTARHVLRDSEVREERRLIRAHLICSLPNAQFDFDTSPHT